MRGSGGGDTIKFPTCWGEKKRESKKIRARGGSLTTAVADLLEEVDARKVQEDHYLLYYRKDGKNRRDSKEASLTGSGVRRRRQEISQV